jgi:hypothetical protein
MQDAAALVYKALNSDTTLINLLGGKVPANEWNRIYNSPVAPHDDEYPRITMFEVINDDAVPADNEYLCSDVNIRLDIWLDDIKNLFDICKRIKQVLKSNFETCIAQLESTMYEKQTKKTIIHKPINIYLLLEQGDE